MGVWLVLLLAVGGTTVSGFAQTNTQPVNQSDAQRRLDERAPIWLKAFNVTGIGIADIENGEIAWTAFYGDQVPPRPARERKDTQQRRLSDQDLHGRPCLAVGIGWEAIFGRIDCRILDRSRCKRQRMEQAINTSSLPLSPNRPPQLAVPDEERAAISMINPLYGAITMNKGIDP